MAAFTTDWVTPHEENWRKHVLPLLPESKRSWLELGSFEGRSALWVLDNALRNGDELVCVDTFYWPDRERTFDHAIGSRATKVVAKTVHYLAKAIHERKRFHAVYIDADHSPTGVLQDAVMAFQCTHPYGAMIFDDYPWTWPDGRPGPKAGIDTFLDLYAKHLKVLHHGWQVIVQKASE